MKIELLKSKIHRATVTDANKDYVGSVTLGKKLIDAANLVEYEKVQVLNITNGNRLETYVIQGNDNTNEVCINGAAAHLVNKGDVVIIASYCRLNQSESLSFSPTIVHVNENNQITNKELESLDS